MEIETKIALLGLKLPKPPTPAGAYVPSVRVGNLLFLSGTLSSIDGSMTHTGKVGEKQTVETGYAAAQVAMLNQLAAIKAVVGELNRVERFVMVNGYVNAVAGFAESPAVINGASELVQRIYGECGKHARAAVAVAGLPKDATVEIQCVVELKP